MHDTGSVINSYVTALISAVKKQGISEANLFALLPIDAEELKRPSARLDMSLMTLLWQRAVLLTGDEYLGLHVGQQLHQGAYNLLGSLVFNSATVQEALEQVVRYQALVSEGGKISLSINPQECLVEYRPAKTQVPMTHYQIEGIISGFFTFSQQIIPDGLTPLNVKFMHTAPKDIKLYESFFSCPVEFNCPHNGFVFQTKQLSTAIPHSDPELFSHHRWLAEKKLQTIQGSQGLLQRAKLCIENSNNWFELSPQYVANHLKLSLRQMQRLLKEEHTSYQLIFDSARKEKAALLLIQGELKTDSIAQLLGYENLSSFHRAFKRWFNLTPALYQKNCDQEIT